MALRARAWSPCHVTGFFAIRDTAPDPLARGSVGAGFSLAHGVTAEVGSEPAARPWSLARGIEVRRGRKRERVAALRVTARILGSLADEVPASERRHRLRIAFTEELPVEQGFGISGASALSLALALSEIYDLPQATAHAIAHIAEVESSTGLGDVPAQIVGGFEARVRPGLAPKGRIRRIGIDGPVVLTSLGPRLPTSKVLGDADARSRIDRAGAGAIRRFLRRPDPDSFAAESRRFALESRLSYPPVARLAERLSGIAPAGQVMLGRTLFALPVEEDVNRVLGALPPGVPRWISSVGTRPCGVLV